MASLLRTPPSRVALFACALFLGIGVAGVAAQPFTLQGPGLDPRDFRVTVFASGLNFPYGMARLKDRSLLVATSDPTGGSYFRSTGTLLRFVDANRDGVADAAGTILFSGLPGPLTALCVTGRLVFVTSSGATRRITVLRTGRRPGDPLTLVGTIDFAFPAGWEHTTYALAARRAQQSTAYDLFFNVGSRGNADQDETTVNVTGLMTGTLAGASIYRVTVRDRFPRPPSFTKLMQVASGLRNAAGLALQASRGDLYLAENGIDGLVDRNEPLSVDELGRIPRAGLKGAVEDFGFPASYVEYRTGTVVGGAGIAPLATFQPIPSPDGSESEGPAQIALSPARFRAPLKNGVFVGFHGRFDRAGVVNEENPLVFWSRATGEYFHVVSNDEPAVGHLDGLCASGDSLFVSDLDRGGALVAGGGGVIYQIAAAR
jgi:glucose/arabinose dehydrogenase